MISFSNETPTDCQDRLGTNARRKASAQETVFGRPVLVAPFWSPRFGRPVLVATHSAELPGEDPVLSGTYATEMVSGMQEKDAHGYPKAIITLYIHHNYKNDLH